MLVPFWFAVCAIAHVHAGAPFLFPAALATAIKDKKSSSNNNGWIQAYVDWGDVDNRYLNADSCVLAFEGLSCFVVSALCVLVAVLHVRKSKFYHPLRIVVCTAHAYGTLVYWLSAAFNKTGNRNAQQAFSQISQNNFDFYFMFCLLNSTWIWVPLLLLSNSVTFLCRAVEQLKEK